MSVTLTVIVTVMRDGEGSRHEAPGLEHRHVDRRVVSLAVDVGPEVLLPGGQGGAAQQHGAGEPSESKLNQDPILVIYSKLIITYAC